jgi:hypothetical protein
MKIIELKWGGIIPCDILVPHIDSWVQIIDKERASPYETSVFVKLFPT